MTTCPGLLLAFVFLAAAGCATTPPTADGEADTMEAVVKRSFTLYGFTLDSGEVLPNQRSRAEEPDAID